MKKTGIRRKIRRKISIGQEDKDRRTRKRTKERETDKERERRERAKERAREKRKSKREKRKNKREKRDRERFGPDRLQHLPPWCKCHPQHARTVRWRSLPDRSQPHTRTWRGCPSA